MDKQLTLPGYPYPEMTEVEQNSAASALLGLAMEEPVLYMPSFTDLVGDVYAGFFLSWFIKKCRYGKSIVLTDEDVNTLFGFSKNRWHTVRRILKQLDYLLSWRENGETRYALNESYFSDAQKHIRNPLPAVPVEPIIAAAMLDSGLRLQDVLMYSIIREQQPYRPPEQRGSYSDWFVHDSVQQQKLAVLSAEEQHKAIHSLYKSEILQVEQMRGLQTVRYRIHYDTVAELSWRYIHAQETDKEAANEC